MQPIVLLDDSYLLVTRSGACVTADEERDSWGEADLHPFRKGLGKLVLGDTAWTGDPSAAWLCLDRGVGQNHLQRSLPNSTCSSGKCPWGLTCSFTPLGAQDGQEAQQDVHQESLLLTAPFTGQHLCVCPDLLRNMWPFSWQWDLFPTLNCCEGVSVVLFNSLLSLCLGRFKGCTVHGGCRLYCTARGAALQYHPRCLWQGLGLLTFSLVSSPLKLPSLFASIFASSFSASGYSPASSCGQLQESTC